MSESITVDNDILEQKGQQIFHDLTEDRKRTLESIKQISDYPDFNIFEMDIQYDYNLEEATKPWNDLPDTNKIMQHLINIAVPGAEIPYSAPDYGCSAFSLRENQEDAAMRSTDQKNNRPHTFMGRNYDFKFDSAAMLVRCNPKNGYKSVSFAGLDHIMDNNPMQNMLAKVGTLICPFIPLDGVNEKGVGVTVLTLDSKPTIHNNGRKMITPGTLIRLVLDKAASTAEAIELLKEYDINSICGRDYHYYINDSTGDGRVVEYDCNSDAREMIVTPSDAITNFFKRYEDKVLPNQNNGIYGHGKERYDSINEVIESHNGHGGIEVAWEALKAAAQNPNPIDITSNTQWSVIYNNTTLDFEIVLRRKWDDIFKFKF